MRRYLLYSFLICNFTLFISCKKDKLKAPKASFLVVDHVTLKTNSTQGVNSHNIVDMWYYVDGEFKGVFPVGGVMPIISSGTAEITLFAGIKNNGISSTRLPYSIYRSKIYRIDIEPGKTYTLSPEFEYNTSAFFYYADNFDANPGQGSYFSFGGSLPPSNTKDFDMTKSFGGSGGSIFMTMTDAAPQSQLVQASGYYLPDGGAVIYVELDYKCNQEFNVGLIGGGSDVRDVVTVTRSDEWKHIYIQLTSTVSTAPTYGSYKVYIEAKKITATPEIYIDNVKLIYQ
jgi:hypothetical protein